jgi:hypothetical protein
MSGLHRMIAVPIVYHFGGAMSPKELMTSDG